MASRTWSSSAVPSIRPSSPQAPRLCKNGTCVNGSITVNDQTGYSPCPEDCNPPCLGACQKCGIEVSNLQPHCVTDGKVCPDGSCVPKAANCNPKCDPPCMPCVEDCRDYGPDSGGPHCYANTKVLCPDLQSCVNYSDLCPRIILAGTCEPTIVDGVALACVATPSSAASSTTVRTESLER
jgi:hypothetical protein